MIPLGIGELQPPIAKRVDRLASGSRFRLQNLAAGDRWRLGYDSVLKFAAGGRWRLACEAVIAGDSPVKR